MSLLKWPETSLRDSPTITIVNFFVATSVDNTYNHCMTIVIVVVQYVLSTSSNKKLTIGQFFIYDRMTVEGRAMYFVKWPPVPDKWRRKKWNTNAQQVMQYTCLPILFCIIDYWQSHHQRPVQPNACDPWDYYSSELTREGGIPPSFSTNNCDSLIKNQWLCSSPMLWSYDYYTWLGVPYKERRTQGKCGSPDLSYACDGPGGSA